MFRRVAGRPVLPRTGGGHPKPGHPGPGRHGQAHVGVDDLDIAGSPAQPGPPARPDRTRGRWTRCARGPASGSTGGRIRSRCAYARDVKAQVRTSLTARTVGTTNDPHPLAATGGAAAVAAGRRADGAGSRSLRSSMSPHPWRAAATPLAAWSGGTYSRRSVAALPQSRLARHRRVPGAACSADTGRSSNRSAREARPSSAPARRIASRSSSFTGPPPPAQRLRRGSSRARVLPHP